MIGLQEIKDSLLHLMFPHICAGCGSDLLPEESVICLRCLNRLPETNFELYPGNPVEKIFWGRLQLKAASAQYYFTKESLMQELMHEFKYKGNKELGRQLGRIMGTRLLLSERFRPDALVPLPLFASKEKRRGYNQANIICLGMAEVMHIPVLDKVVARTRFTETQTSKGRIERWSNMDGRFLLTEPATLANSHILLVDDVVTTGATLEACGQELLKAENLNLSFATLCFASRR